MTRCARRSLNADPKDNGKYIHRIILRASPFRDSKPDFGALKVIVKRIVSLISIVTFRMVVFN
jgi:hypothetical protein